MNPPITPAGILQPKPPHDLAYLFADRRAASPIRIAPLPHDQTTMPSWVAAAPARPAAPDPTTSTRTSPSPPDAMTGTAAWMSSSRATPSRSPTTPHCTGSPPRGARSGTDPGSSRSATASAERVRHEPLVVLAGPGLPASRSSRQCSCSHGAGWVSVDRRGPAAMRLVVLPGDQLIRPGPVQGGSGAPDALFVHRGPAAAAA